MTTGPFGILLSTAGVRIPHGVLLLPAPSEILVIVFVAFLLLAGTYVYRKLQEGKIVYRRTREEDNDR